MKMKTRAKCSTAKTNEHNMLDETSVVDGHQCHIAAKFGVFVDEGQSKHTTLYWLPKLHKRSCKSRFIVNLVHVLLPSCLYF